MAIVSAHAITLHSMPYREADAIVWYYSAEFGQIQAVVKNCKKPNNPLSGAVMPLTVNWVGLRGKHSLKTLTSYQRKASFSLLHNDIERISAATVCADLVRSIGQENETDSHVTFSQLFSTLNAFNTPDIPWESTSLEFHKAFLDVAGYGLDWDVCFDCDTSLEPTQATYFAFSAEIGGFLCASCLHHRGLGRHQRVLVSSPTLALCQQPTDTNSHSQILKAHRFLAYIWQVRLEKPVQSMEFLLHLLHSNTASTQVTNEKPAPAQADTG